MQNSHFQTKEALHRAAEELVTSRERRLLLIEDTAAHAALIQRALKNANWKIDHATRGSTGLEQFSRAPHSIVLLDLTLPDTDGLTLLGRLHAMNSKAPVIIVTATDLVKVSVEAMQKGAWDYVVKGEPRETSENILRAVEAAYLKRLGLAEQELLEQTRILELVRNERLEAIELVVRTVCHEVNNPLSGIVALSQLLAQNARLDVDLKRLADGIARSAGEVARVVEKLRTISDQPVEFGGQQILAAEESPDGEEK